MLHAILFGLVLFCYKLIYLGTWGHCLQQKLTGFGEFATLGIWDLPSPDVTAI